MNPVNTDLTNPANTAIGSLLSLDAVYINNKKFSYSDYVKDPSNFDQRMNYFKAIFAEIANIHADPIALLAYNNYINKELELSNFRASPYPSIAGAPAASLYSPQNQQYSQQLQSWARNFWNNSIIPSVNAVVPRKKVKI